MVNARIKPKRKPSRGRPAAPAPVALKRRARKRIPALAPVGTAAARQPTDVPVAGGHGRGAVAGMVESGAIVAQGLEGIGQAWLELTRGALQDGAATARAMMDATSPQQVIDLQAGFARAALGRLMEQGGRITALSLAVAAGRLWRPVA